jgi:4-hydroxybenzoate polyprenyltransferase
LQGDLPLIKRIRGLIRLTRFRDFLAFVTITTLMGAIAAEASLSWRLVIILIANQLAVGFAFMINDVEDAEDDAMNPSKVHRNPVSSKDVSHRSGYVYSFIVAGMAVICYAFLGWVPFIFGVISVLVGFFYSWKPVRFKNIFIIDLLTHCFMLAGLQYLPAFYSFQSQMTIKGLFPLLFVILFSLYGELFNELRDLEHDLKAGLRHTAAILGYKVTFWLMISIASLGVVSGIITLFFVNFLPAWELIVLFVLVALFLIPPMLKITSAKSQLEIQHAFQEPIEHGAVIGFALYFLIPPLLHLFNLG